MADASVNANVTRPSLRVLPQYISAMMLEAATSTDDFSPVLNVVPEDVSI